MCGRVSCMIVMLQVNTVKDYQRRDFRPLRTPFGLAARHSL